MDQEIIIDDSEDWEIDNRGLDETWLTSKRYPGIKIVVKIDTLFNLIYNALENARGY